MVAAAPLPSRGSGAPRAWASPVHALQGAGRWRPQDRRPIELSGLKGWPHILLWVLDATASLVRLSLPSVQGRGGILAISCRWDGPMT